MTFVKTSTLSQPNKFKIQEHTRSVSFKKHKPSEDSLTVALPPPSNQLASSSRSRTSPDSITNTNVVAKTESNKKPHPTHPDHETDRDSGEIQQANLSGRNRCISSDESIVRWVFNRASIAPCFVRDVFQMQDGNLEQDYFWLGRVPCRTVRVVGMVVGVDEFDEMSRYKLDDGTAVIDCEVKHPRSSSTKSTHDRKSFPRNKDKHKRPPEKVEEKTKEKEKQKFGHMRPRIFPVGTSVSMEGRVIEGRGSRFLRADSHHLTVCRSQNEEPLHWMTVLQLHTEHYFLKEPFEVPSYKNDIGLPKDVAATPTKAMNGNGDENENGVNAGSPLSTKSSRTSHSTSIQSSPGTSAYSTSNQGSSPPRPISSNEPPRLRHPSRLRSRDLTDNTFRIYLKHYMDFAPPYRPPPSSPSSPSSFSFHIPAFSSPPPPSQYSRRPSSKRGERCTTPTPTTPEPKTPIAKRKRTYPVDTDDDVFATPRPGQARVRVWRNDSNTGDEAEAVDGMRIGNDVGEDGGGDGDNDENEVQYGFTLSYLRRVPVLAQMARSVVHAERKRREKKEREQERERLRKGESQKLASARSYNAMKANTMSTSTKKSSESTSRKVKRLYQKAIRDLYAEGSIVLWEGPRRRIYNTDNDDNMNDGDEDNDIAHEDDTSYLWKSRTNTTISTLHSSHNTSSSSDELSEPTESEESYLPITPHTTRTLVLSSLRALTQRTFASGTSRRRTPPTTEGILRHIGNTDERWKNLGVWRVKEALEALEGMERVFRAGEERWALCA